MSEKNQDQSQNQDQAQEQNDQSKSDPSSLKVGEKEYTADQIQELVARDSQAGAVLTMAQNHGLTIEEFLGNVDLAFNTVDTLVNQGVIDKEGNIFTPAAQQTELSTTTARDVAQPEAQLSGILKKLSVIEKATQGYGDRMGQIEEAQGKQTRAYYASEIKQQHPTLSDKDIGQVFAIATNDRTKGLWDHVNAYVQQKGEQSALMEKEVLEKYGVDPEKADINRLKQQGDTGGLSRKFQEKSFTFKRGVKGSVTPREATVEYLKAIGEG